MGRQTVQERFCDARFFDELAQIRTRDLRLVVIDESSMVNKQIFGLLINHAEEKGQKIIFMGDPAQLPPVKEKESMVFSSDMPRHQLTEPQRQSADKPLYQALLKLRDPRQSMRLDFNYNRETREGVATYCPKVRPIRFAYPGRTWIYPFFKGRIRTAFSGSGGKI